MGDGRLAKGRCFSLISVAEGIPALPGKEAQNFPAVGAWSRRHKHPASFTEPSRNASPRQGKGLRGGHSGYPSKEQTAALRTARFFTTRTPAGGRIDSSESSCWSKSERGGTLAPFLPTQCPHSSAGAGAHPTGALEHWGCWDAILGLT